MVLLPSLKIKITITLLLMPNSLSNLNMCKSS